MKKFEIDDEIDQFIEKTNSFYPPDTFECTIEAQRDRYDRMCAAFHQPYPDGVSATDETIDRSNGKIAVRHYQTNSDNNTTAVVYYHGGGFVVGGLHSHDDVCAEICAATGYHVIAVDYRLCPEHAYPDDFNDALAVFLTVSANYARVIVVGDSAGATLAASVSHAQQSNAIKPAGQVLIYPAFGGYLFGLSSYIDNADAPLLSTKEVNYHVNLRAGGNVPQDDPLFFPLLAKDFGGLPHSIIFTADIDPLRDDGREYTQRLRAAGVNATWHNEIGLIHGYLRARHCSVKARTSFQRICTAIKQIGH